MNTHSVNEALRLYLQGLLPDISIHTPVNCDSLSEPYILVSCTADSELIPKNHTWACNVSVEVHTSAHDQDEEASRNQAADLFALLAKRCSREAVNALSTDFLLYSFALSSVLEPEAVEDAFIQRGEFRAVVQF